METGLYRYNATVRSVYDGDTCTMDVDLGLGCWVHGEKIRLCRINAPELRLSERPRGLLSRDFLRSKIDKKKVILETIKDKKGKYGRYLGEIWIKDADENWINIKDMPYLRSIEQRRGIE